jgi:hypothetical protein
MIHLSTYQRNTSKSEYRLNIHKSGMKVPGKYRMKNIRLLRFREANRSSSRESHEYRKSIVRQNVGLLNVKSGDTLIKNYALSSKMLEPVCLPPKDMIK